MKQYQKVLLYITGILASIWAIKEMFVANNYKPAVPKNGQFANPLVRMNDRGTDIWGNGDFGAIRTSHLHEGNDYLCEPDEIVYAPFDGTFDRVAYPYSNDKNWKGGLLKSKDGVYEIKIFYFNPDAGAVGKKILKGLPIGKCQDISIKYPKIKPHIHVEIRENGKLKNPDYFFSITGK